MKLSGLERILLGVLLLMLVAVGMGACAQPSTARDNPEDAYVTFDKTLPSGKVVECVGWEYQSINVGSAIECFPK